MDRTEMVAGLRQLADLIEQHEEIALYGDDITIRNYVHTPDEMLRLTRAVGGRWEKVVDENYYRLVRRLRGGVAIQVYSSRESVCEAKVVGTEPVTEQRVTDPERAAQLKAELEALTEEVVVGEREIVEWDCKPVLASRRADQALDVAMATGAGQEAA